ncbi:prephenate dehydrogenase/arogenate dehydrogenase family protein [Taklimakanibacter lacteus]|uniref:prephenate dehydrogenase/arogenate dehydrogenase family protein n=1 Tax=Taklimakanibacter lacteus TaxID=2268456 RepID=UPI000E66D95D
MSKSSNTTSSLTVGIIGFGAFGQLIARHIRPHFQLCAHDPAPSREHIAEGLGVALTSLETAARCPVVVLAAPVGRLKEIVEAIAPHIRPGALVLDVGSVKLGPADIMKRGLPAHAEIVATHPLFGPQSARDGIAGLKIAVCPIRGRSALRLAAFLRHRLRLNVIMTTPEDHDREAATVQGLTHLIAKVLVRMEPLPRRMTTKSFDLLMEAVNMVRHDAPEVFAAIESANPYSPGVRRRFFELAAALNDELADGKKIHSRPLQEAEAQANY